MTRDQIIAKWNGMSPRERDAWVAEVVTEITPEYDEKLNWHGWKTGTNSWSSSIPFYSTEISAAWAVVECHPYVEVARIPGEVPVYGVRVNDNEGMVRAMTQSKTAPEAICLAAIIAKLSPTV